QPAARVGSLGRRDRARAAAVAAVRVQASARAEGGRFRAITNRSAAASVSTQAGAPHATRRMARAVPALLVDARRRAGTASGEDGEEAIGEREEKDMSSSREQYAPGPASGADVRKDGDRWTLILVRELRHAPERVWEALTDPAQLREW